MAIEVIEKIDSRESTTGKSATVDLTYIITGTSDDIAARTELAAVAPPSYTGLVVQSYGIEPIGDPTESLAYEATVRYGRFSRSSPEAGDSTFSFDTGGGTQHITQSLQTVSSYAEEGSPPDFGGAIGVTHDNVEGVDITIPVYNFSETHYLAPADVDQSCKLNLFHLTGKVNSDTFRGFSPGEVLFLGASGTRRGTGADDGWEIQFRFAASRNKTELSVGGITGIAKNGWEYMWVRYADEVDDGAKTLIKKPVAVYIEKVYDDAAFSGLGI